MKSSIFLLLNISKKQSKKNKTKRFVMSRTYVKSDFYKIKNLFPTFHDDLPLFSYIFSMIYNVNTEKYEFDHEFYRKPSVFNKLLLLSKKREPMFIICSLSKLFVLMLLRIYSFVISLCLHWKEENEEKKKHLTYRSFFLSQSCRSSIHQFCFVRLASLKDSSS